MSIKRMSQELARLEALPLRDIIDEMVEYQSNKVVLTFHGSDQKPAAAVALITGPTTETYVQALELAESDQPADKLAEVNNIESVKQTSDMTVELRFSSCRSAGSFVAQLRGVKEAG